VSDSVRKHLNASSDVNNLVEIRTYDAIKGYLAACSAQVKPFFKYFQKIAIKYYHSKSSNATIEAYFSNAKLFFSNLLGGTSDLGY